LKSIKKKILKLKVMVKRKEKLATLQKISIPKAIIDKFFGVGPRLF
tara:strand:- start:652 stop:789 length:138 start_codon:yes stop_codon:yes gene_type:complete